MRESKFLIFTRYNNNNNNNVIGRAYTLFFWYIGSVCDLEKVIQLQESCVNNTREFLTREWEKKFDSLAVLKLFLSSFLPRFSIVEESRYPWSGGALSSAILLLFFTLALTRAHVFLTLANRIRAKIRERVRKRRVSDVYIIPDDSLHDDIIRASMERIIENRSNNYPILRTKGIRGRASHGGFDHRFEQKFFFETSYSYSTQTGFSTAHTVQFHSFTRGRREGRGRRKKKKE